ncbi:FecR family protein [Novosphingobium beihaiensis]|uniref:FecR domain-containing protein n=1 Tax=Novosphingobium beihaiensis TaxID=2930389 RepID=A0ABT0BLK3_9SPHN|nr:FecR domain-containing protein [Novosphingobium beihaiensis]MCJ2185951.1 FecR domain-containing protein [Novosphingobium beihaiensis]
MNDEDHAEVLAQAAQWHARVLGGDADWDAFAQWLDAAPEHHTAYEKIALLEDDFTRWGRDNAPAAPLSPANDDSSPDAAGRPASTRRRWIAGGAIAAVLTALVSFPAVRQLWPEDPVYYTAQDAPRRIALASGTQVQLDRGTRIAVETGRGEHVDVIRGAIYVDVRHAGGQPLEIGAGDYRIRDIGTRFAVTRRETGVSVAVAQGLVDVSWPGHDPVRLAAGRRLDAAGAQVTVRNIAATSVASWREGRLIYDNAPLSLVASDLSRYTADPIYVDPSVAGLKLSGVLFIRGRADLLQQIEAYLPVEVRGEGDAVHIAGKPGR